MDFMSEILTLKFTVSSKQKPNNLGMLKASVPTRSRVGDCLVRHICCWHIYSRPYSNPIHVAYILLASIGEASGGSCELAPSNFTQKLVYKKINKQNNSLRYYCGMEFKILCLIHRSSHEFQYFLIHSFGAL